MGSWGNILNSLLGAAIGIALMWLISYLGKKALRKKALGEGDIFLMGAVGSLVGWNGVVMTIFFSAVFGSIGGAAIMIARRRRKQTKDLSTIPFGPFIVLAALLVMAFGRDMWKAYISLFG